MSHMPNNTRLREATLEDAAALAALLPEMDDGELAVITHADVAQMRDLLAEMATYYDFRAYLLFQGEKLVGSFSLMIFRSPSHGGARQAMLDAVVIARSARGTGLGQLMIGQALSFAKRAGCYKMSLSSNLKRKSAHRFYEQLGFEQHGISFDIPIAE